MSQIQIMFPFYEMVRIRREVENVELFQQEESTTMTKQKITMKTINCYLTCPMYAIFGMESSLDKFRVIIG